MVLFIVLFRLYSEQLMHFAEAEINEKLSTNSKTRVLGVIVLTDNRQSQATDKKGSQHYRNSAFKETEADPLQFAPDIPGDFQEENLMIELGRRLVFLEQRVESLSKNQVLNAEENQEGRKVKKNRRPFKELTRDHECPHCQKMYGSETSLKNHLKLKHETTSSKNHTQVQ